MLNDLSVIIETEDVNPGVVIVVGPRLVTVEDHVVAVSKHALELDVLTRVPEGRSLEIGYEPFLAVGNTRIVLDVILSDVSLDGVARSVRWLSRPAAAPNRKN